MNATPKKMIRMGTVSDVSGIKLSTINMNTVIDKNNVIASPTRSPYFRFVKEIDFYMKNLHWLMEKIFKL